MISDRWSKLLRHKTSKIRANRRLLQSNSLAWSKQYFLKVKTAMMSLLEKKEKPPIKMKIRLKLSQLL